MGPDFERASFFPDGVRIVTASADGTACLLDAITGQEITVLRHQDRVLSASFSPDGARIVTGLLGPHGAPLGRDN